MTETLAPGDSALPSLARHLDGARPDQPGRGAQGLRRGADAVAGSADRGVGGGEHSRRAKWLSHS